MKIKELYADPSRWTRGWYARDAKGNEVPAWVEQATCWCLLGAIEKCYNYPECDAVRRKIIEDLQSRSIPNWNDEATFEIVKALVERLDV